MEITVKKVAGDYSSEQDIWNLIHYVITRKRSENRFTYIGGQLIYLGDCDTIFNQIMFVKHAYVKNRGKQMIHLVVSAPVFNRYADEDVWDMGRQIAGIFKGHQVLFAVHDDTQYIHLHFAINTVSMFDGSKLQFNPPWLREKISRIIQGYWKRKYRR